MKSILVNKLGLPPIIGTKWRHKLDDQRYKARVVKITKEYVVLEEKIRSGKHKGGSFTYRFPKRSFHNYYRI